MNFASTHVVKIMPKNRPKGKAGSHGDTGARRSQIKSKKSRRDQRQRDHTDAEIGGAVGAR